MSTKKIPTSVSLSEDVYANVKADATKDDRSMARIVDTILREYYVRREEVQRSLGAFNAQ